MNTAIRAGHTNLGVRSPGYTGWVLVCMRVAGYALTCAACRLRCLTCAQSAEPRTITAKRLAWMVLPTWRYVTPLQSKDGKTPFTDVRCCSHNVHTFLAGVGTQRAKRVRTRVHRVFRHTGWRSRGPRVHGSWRRWLAQVRCDLEEQRRQTDGPDMTRQRDKLGYGVIVKR